MDGFRGNSAATESAFAVRYVASPIVTLLKGACASAGSLRAVAVAAQSATATATLHMSPFMRAPSVTCEVRRR